MPWLTTRSDRMSSITDRIERELGIPGLAFKLAERLDPADLQSLLLDVYRRMVKRRPTTTILADYETNRFVRPAAYAPARYLEWERLALSLLPPVFEALELSPVCPLGASAAMAGLSQDRALATIRNTEVVSDSTNVLALEAASRRRALKGSDSRSRTPVHLAAAHRLVRTQRYSDPRLASHFSVFSLCSAGRDRGSFGFETDSLLLHIDFYLAAIRALLGRSVSLRVLITALETGDTLAGAVLALLEHLRREHPDADFALHPERTVAREYYRSLCFWIYVASEAGDAVQLVDGGCVDWTQRLLSDAKERLVISGAGTDRILAMREPDLGG
jgi:hypothetical protein